MNDRDNVAGDIQSSGLSGTHRKENVGISGDVQLRYGGSRCIQPNFRTVKLHQGNILFNGSLTDTEARNHLHRHTAQPAALFKDRDRDSCSAQKICCGNTSGTTADNSGLPSVGDRRRLFQRTHQCVISVFRRHELRFPNMNGFIIVISSTLCLAAVGTNGSCGEGEGIFLRNER